MPDTPDKLAALMTGALPSPTAPDWEAQMRAAITRGHLAAWLAGTGERLGVKPGSALLSEKRLSRAERAEIKALVEAQLAYLRGFAAARGEMSEAQIAARAKLYAQAVKGTYDQARWGDWVIPDYLYPGRQQCQVNCLCRISVRDNGDGTGVLTREMGGTEYHCGECPPLAGEYDVHRKGAGTKHLPGGHDQRSHGRSTPRRAAARGAYADARAAGQDMAQARQTARDVSELYRVQQRMADITQLMGGHVSEGQRRSLQAELDRQAERINTLVGRNDPNIISKHSPSDAFAPKVKGRDDPRAFRAHTPSAEAREALAKMQNLEPEIERLKGPVRELRRQNWEEQAQLMTQREALVNQGKTRRHKAVREIDDRLKTLDAQSDLLLQQALAIETKAPQMVLRATTDPAHVGLRWGDTPPIPTGRQREIEGTINDAMLLTSSRGLHNTRMRIGQEPNVRAFAENWGDDFSIKGRIVLAPSDGPRVIAHELGHHIEFRDPAIRARAVAFRDARTRGETEQPLKAITGNPHFRDDEVARPDRFISPYMGKQYRDGSTEIISMGLEYFFSDPVSLAKQDPEYFTFMYDVLRS